MFRVIKSSKFRVAKKLKIVAFGDSDNFIMTQSATKTKKKKIKKAEFLDNWQINAMQESQREELLYDVDPSGEDIKIFKCPEIHIKIENIAVKALLDSGSEVTCISQEFYERNQGIFEEKPILPISGKVIKGATGEKSTKLKMQLLSDVEIGGVIIKLLFVVIPKLIKDCIFGYDSQKSIGMLLDTINQKMYYSIENKKFEIPYVDTFVRPTEYSTLRIEIEKAGISEKTDFEPKNLEKIHSINSTLNKFKYKTLYANELKNFNLCISISCEQWETLNNILNKKVLIPASNPKERHLLEEKLSLDSISSIYEKIKSFSKKINCRPEGLDRMSSRTTEKVPIFNGKIEKILIKAWILKLVKQKLKKKCIRNIYMHKYKAAINVHIEIVDVLCHGDLKGTNNWIKKTDQSEKKINNRR